MESLRSKTTEPPNDDDWWIDWWHTRFEERFVKQVLAHGHGEFWKPQLKRLQRPLSMEKVYQLIHRHRKTIPKLAKGKQPLPTWDLFLLSVVACSPMHLIAPPPDKWLAKSVELLETDYTDTELKKQTATPIAYIQAYANVSITFFQAENVHKHKRDRAWQEGLSAGNMESPELDIHDALSHVRELILNSKLA